MKIKSIILALLAFACLAAPATAQIKAGKAIFITIAGVPSEEKAQFPEKIVVQQNGMIQMPYIGKVKAAGLQAGALADKLRKAYIDAEIYTRPVFQVVDNDQRDIDRQVVTVGGRVKRAGDVEFRDKLTLWEAIQAAGGPDEFGAMRRVELNRNGQLSVHDIKDPNEQDPLLRPGDKIQVPQVNAFGR